MIGDVAVARLCVEDLVSPEVLSRVVDVARFYDEVVRYLAMSDDDLYRATEVCLCNVDRLEDESRGPDAELQLVLVPELWERLRPGVRDLLRRLGSTLAEYQADQPSVFARMLSAQARDRLRASAEELRRQVLAAQGLDVRSLVEQTGRAIVSRAPGRWSPDYPVYEAGFAYRLVPALAWRVLVRSRASALESEG